LNPKILILHSDTQVLQLISTYLNNNGYIGQGISGETELYPKIKGNSPPHLILIELEYAHNNITGVTLAQEILNSYSLPVIFITSKRNSDILIEAEGINHYGIIHQDSIQSRLLLSTIQTALRLFRTEYQHKASEQKYRFFFNSIPIAAIVSDQAYTVQEWNHSAAELFGYQRHEVIGKNLIKTLSSKKNDKNSEQLQDLLLEQLENRKKSHNYNYDRTKDGRDLLCEWYDLPYKHNRNTYILSVAKDITDQQELIEELRDTVIEKEFLLRETHHRVKNSLNMINSLINLKAGNLEAQEAFTDLKGKIKALSSLYEKLHQTTDVSVVNLQHYLDELLHSLFITFSEFPIKTETQLNQISIDPDTAITIGLIVNEIATNAIKHGFIPEEKSWFKVVMESENQGTLFILKISNSGNPLPRAVDITSMHTLGFRLIQTLVDQLKGNLEITREPHPVYTIRFPRKSTVHSQD